MVLMLLREQPAWIFKGIHTCLLYLQSSMAMPSILMQDPFQNCGQAMVQRREPPSLKRFNYWL
jgi:hypothetical protein